MTSIYLSAFAAAAWVGGSAGGGPTIPYVGVLNKIAQVPWCTLDGEGGTRELTVGTPRGELGMG